VRNRTAGHIPAALAQALAPFAPASSSVHEDAKTSTQIEQDNRERFVLGLLTDECKTCKKEDLMDWWSWRDQQFDKVERINQEAAAVRADLRINELKNSGELRQREDARALAEQVQWGVR